MIRLFITVGCIVFSLGPTSSFGQEKWVDLFANQSFELWDRIGNKGSIEDNWRFDDQGWLQLYRPTGHSGTLLSKELYKDFELSFYWKINPNANSGIKYRVLSFGKNKLGLEYQLLDDVAKKAKPKNQTASIYDIFPPDKAKKLNAPLSINHSRILVSGNRIEHWLNGQRVVNAQPASPPWRDAISRSKFSDRHLFGENAEGKLMLTDHGGTIWFRDVILKPISN